ncbi:MAG: hypothetical protein VB877_07190, partial [Pirellulaceae bacterium]
MLLQLERLVHRRLLSGASLPAVQGPPRQPMAIIANDPGDSLSNDSRPTLIQQAPRLKSVTDSVLSVVAQATTASNKKGSLEPSRGTHHVSERPRPGSDTVVSLDTMGSFFPRGESAPPFRLPRSIPQGLFPDGSVRAVHPDIDPHVYRALQASGQGPFKSTLHRSTSIYGAPTGTAAGTDPQLLLLAGMRPNWQAATGPLTYTRQSFSITELAPRMTAATVYHHLKDFRHFDQDNLAQVRLIRPGILDPAVLQERQFALFRVRVLLETRVQHTHWALANTIQRLVNSNPVAVELHYHDRLLMIEAVTLGNHMLVGMRRWQVMPRGPRGIQVTSESWTHCNGKLNQVAMQGLGPLAMERIWSKYLSNIGQAVKMPGSRLTWQPLVHQEFKVTTAVSLPPRFPWPLPGPATRSSDDPGDLFSPRTSFHRPSP